MIISALKSKKLILSFIFLYRQYNLLLLLFNELELELVYFEILELELELVNFKCLELQYEPIYFWKELSRHHYRLINFIRRNLIGFVQLHVWIKLTITNTIIKINGIT